MTAMSIPIAPDEIAHIEKLSQQASIGIAAQKQLDGIIEMKLAMAGIKLKEGDQVKVTDTDMLVIRLPETDNDLELERLGMREN